jgi:MFS family permease
MVFVHRPGVFLVVAALAGMGWTLSASELWVASQRAMSDWARGRMNATMVMVAQAATALGGVLWGLAAHNAGVVPTFLGAAVFGLLVMIMVRVVPALQISIDFTKSLSFESAERSGRSAGESYLLLVGSHVALCYSAPAFRFTQDG